MRNNRAILAVLGLVGIFCTNVRAQTTQSIQSDVVLGAGGTLVGQLLGPNKQPISGEEIRFLDASGKVVVAKANKNGVFTAQGLSRGSLIAQTTTTTSYLRGWPQGTEPRNAQRNLVINASKHNAAAQMQASPAAFQVPMTGTPVQPVVHTTPVQQPSFGPFRRVLNGVKGRPGVAVGTGVALGAGIWGITELADDNNSAS